MKTQPKVSVIIPTYNVEKYIRKAIESILDQTYQKLEIIVVDDGSTDNTYGILEELKQKDIRIRLFKNDKNLNIVKTLNKALQYVTGDMIARMDGDDVSEAHRIEKQVNFLVENEDVDLVGSHSFIIDENDEITGELCLPVSHDECLSVINVMSPVSHIWLARKTLYIMLNGYRNLPGAEDYDFILRAITSGFKVANYDEKLYRVRVRAGNSNTTLGLKQFKTSKYVRNLYKDRIKDGNDSFNRIEYENKIKSFKITEFIYVKSYPLLRKAGEYRNKRMFLFSILYTFIYFIVCPYSLFKVYKNMFLFFNKQNRKKC